MILTQRTSILLPAACACALLAASACSSTANDEHDVLKPWEQARFDQLFRMVDADGNGRVDKAEFGRNYVPTTWKYFDKDGSGGITQEEWALDGTAPERVAWFRALDADRDGRVSRTEFQAAGSPEAVDYYFRVMDSNGDGTITKDDLGR